MKRYTLLDVFRLLCACLVVVIHLGTGPRTPIASMVVTCFSRQAVPFFFMVSGFFFAGKLKKAEDPKCFVWTYAKRMLLLYGIWVLILLPQTVIDYSQMYQGRSWLYIAILLARRILLAGLAQFWYILALAETALIAGLLLANGRQRILYGIAWIGFLSCMVYCAEIPAFRLYSRLIYTVFSWNCNFLMLGLPFFSAGIYFFEHQEKITLKTGTLVWAYWIDSAAAIVCYWILKKAGIYPERVIFFYTIQAVLLFLIGIKSSMEPVSPKAAVVCRECSCAVYCLHNFVIEYILGEAVPWSSHFAVNLLVVLSICIAVFCIVKALRITPVYRLITLK